ncbi:hypothetical protein AV530_019845 [Patagioenas fasciata monilis]|uniref:Uncharacterized protein n=1 Tax=Patagioenas fasciata monilis TaxID=372326 RepID=A0A1V4JTA3_PATFA|nr:hypothetical protein AV530_019845 [Patagioenas fasciata monilis]
MHLHPAPPLLQPCCTPAQDVPSLRTAHLPLTDGLPRSFPAMPSDAWVSCRLEEAVVVSVSPHLMCFSRAVQASQPSPTPATGYAESS